ncbi:peptidylglycine alpha-hydroxylating monooxygenase-like [Stylophora pistillata]|uniref:peptidylglycine alpha-hydroxylating monooxygenase-like n=1 Tax=Stylophora pistillata TaxID=50429 RepID=UPI000C0395CE|nr:peptidylglycine alpha-hydroxylating monooxygenase-like [Stylophora pistillata]
MMSRTFATIFVLVSSYVTMCTAYEDDKEPIWDFDDILSQRSQAEKQQDRDESSEILKFAMPGVHPTKEDTYLCTAVDLHRKEEYIVAIKPLVDMHTAHHLMIFGCPEPANYAFANDGKYWTCGESGPNKCSHGSTAKILYAWGRNAPELDLPPGTARQYSPISYALFSDPTLKDYAGAELHMMSVRPSQLAAVFLLQPFGDIPPKKKAWHFDIGCQYHDGPVLHPFDFRFCFSLLLHRPSQLAAVFLLQPFGDIPPKKKAWHFDIGCQYHDGPVLHPFDFRVHTHGIGTVVTGYRIRDGKWTLIGKMDPQRPQAFYPVDNLVDIKSGDTIAARCTFNSMQRNRVTHSGLTHEDEMCNFYMMYWYDPKQGKAASNPRDLCQLLDPNNLDYPSRF